MKTSISIATINDLQLIAELMVEVQNIQNKIRPDIFKKGDSKEFFIFFKDIIKSPENLLLKITYESSIVGYGLGKLINKKDTPIFVIPKRLSIEHISIHPNFKRNGLGTNLIEEFKSIAKKNDIKTIELNVWNKNIDAFKFYQTLGFAPRETRMELTL